MESNDDIIRLEQIDSYLNGNLRNGERLQFEQQLQHNPALAREVENLKITRSIIRNYGLREDLKNIHAQAMAERNRHRNTSLFRYSLGIAATAVLLLVCFVAIQLASVSGSSLSERFTAYEPIVIRGDAGPENELANQMKTDYLGGQYQAVVSSYEASPDASITEAFLAGNAYLKLSAHPQAISAFERVLQLNEAQNGTQYKADAEYYLGWAYLKNHQADEAEDVFRRIRRNPTHKYHSRVDGWFSWQLRLLEWKEKLRG